jgi:hypothetical protein
MTTRPGQPAAGPPPPAGEGVRCGCGSLLARVVAGGIELKCRRCRRCLVVKLGPDGGLTIGDLAAAPCSDPE